MIRPEVLSPVGHWPQLHAAIDAGADAVYFGVSHFNERAKVGFTLAELPEAMQTLHRHGVKGYVTYNSLVFDSELPDAARGLASIAEAGADAIIVQDLAVVKLAREIAPSLEIHGSTQMSVTSAEGARVARSLGASRVVLARELSLDEIRAIRGGTDCGLEVFVHGALCVSYSGQCFSSEAWGGRSANRGQCAQACRLPYEMLVDGVEQPLGDARYLLSPGDLYALHQIPELVRIGVTGLKIEGRYKDSDYVTLTTRAYRKAVDEACAGLPLSVRAAEESQLEQVYSRGLGAYFLTGTNHQAVVNGRSPRHRGVLCGRVTRVERAGIVIESSETTLRPGDGIVFDAADWLQPQEPEEGGRVYEIEMLPGGRVELRFGNGIINPSRIRAGDLVWRTHDPAIEKALRALPARKQPLRAHVTARTGEPLHIKWTVHDVTVETFSEEPLQAAQNRAITAEYLTAQLGRLGNTPYELESVALEPVALQPFSMDVEGFPFAPASLLNHLRRQAVEALQALQSAPRGVTPADPATALNRLSLAGSEAGAPLPIETDSQVKLHLLVRTPQQLDAALAVRPASITLDYLDLYGLLPSLDRVKAAGIDARVASPRVLKPGEERIADFLLKCDCPILVRSAGLLETLAARAHRALTGDFSLNAANAISARELLHRGLDRLAPTHDLNAAQIAELARRTGPEKIEAIVYQHLPVFHTEHCVFCRFLSTGTSYRDCGRPCEHHRVELRDSHGRAHPVMADVGCRNTVFGAEAQEASAHLIDWLDAGIRHFRVEFVHESAAAVTRVSQSFHDALARRLSPADLRRRLREIAPQGVTQGSLLVPAASVLPVLQ